MAAFSYSNINMLYPLFRISLKVLWLLLFLTANISYSYGQEPNTDELLDSLIDDLFFNEEKFIDDILESANMYNLLYTTLTYNSNTYFTGRDIGIDQFNLMPQISFYNSKGFNASVSGIYYSEYLPNWAFTNVSLGYFNYIGKKKLLNYSVGYSRYIYSDGWDILTNSTDVTIGIKNKKRTIGTKLAGSYLFGNGYSFQLISGSYYNLTLAEKKKFAVKFRPQVNFIIAEKAIVSEELLIADYFGLLNTQINMPFNLLTKSWDLEIGYNVNFPKAHEPETDMKPTSFFRFSLGYLIDFSKKKNKQQISKKTDK